MLVNFYTKNTQILIENKSLFVIPAIYYCDRLFNRNCHNEVMYLNQNDRYITSNCHNDSFKVMYLSNSILSFEVIFCQNATMTDT